MSNPPRNLPMVRPPAAALGESGWDWLRLHWEKLLIGTLVLLAALAHLYNMFGFPYYESDEGTYMSQAWAVIFQGELAPYTYWYDHAPVGWFQLGAWSMLTGGFFSFGSPVNTGRVLMWLMKIGAALMVYLIARRATRSPLAGVIATLAFSLSAFGLYYQRRVILDNIAAFWMLLSIYLLTSDRLTLLKVWSSAVALSISILSKELTVFLIPVMTYFVWWRSHRSQRTLATTGWFIIVCSICSMYVLMALLKGELFPPGTAFSPGGDHVSLLGTLMFHAGRERDGGLLYWNSDFWNTYRTWAVDEPLLTLGGSLAMLISILLLPWQRTVGVLGLLTLSLFAFLARGGITLGFYLVPLLPLLAINLAAVIALTVQLVQSWLARGPRPIAALRYGLPAVALAGGMSGLMLGYESASLGYSSNPWSLWNNKQAQVQSIAVNWARENLPADSTIIIDQSMWIELQGPPTDGPRFTRAHYYWKVDRDPEITDGIFEKRWQEADYLITTLQLVGDATRAKLTVTNTALENSVLVARFDTGGWPVEVRRVVQQPATADAAPDSNAAAGNATPQP